MLRLSPEQLLDEAKKKREDPIEERDAKQLAGMLIYHGFFRTNPLLKTKHESWAKKGLLIAQREDDDRMDKVGVYNGAQRDHWYGCRHIQLNGDCGIYATRPSLCRSYPDGRECGFEDCTMPEPTLEEKLQASVKLVAVSSLTKKIAKKKR
jgi:Fe-S-cluster containining protein